MAGGLMDLGGGSSMGAPDTGMGPDPAASDEAGEGAYEPKDDFEREAKDFLDDTLPMGDRITALKEAIKICAEKDYGSSGEGGGEKKPGGLALIFGSPKKKG